MNDWMKIDEAWWYTLERSTPVKGVIVHSAHRSNYRAWFVPDDRTVNDGFDVMDDEGVADGCGVWYLCEVPIEVAVGAFKLYFKNELRKAESEVQYYKNRLKELEYENRKGAGAE